MDVLLKIIAVLTGVITLLFGWLFANDPLDMLPDETTEEATTTREVIVYP